MASTPNYGIDRRCGSDLDPLMRFESGNDLMGHVCQRRLSTRSGRLLSNPVDNTIDTRDFVNKGIALRDLPVIQGQCSSALLGDQRIFTAVTTASFDTVTRTLTLNITGTGASGPFYLTLAVTSVTVELLTA